MITDIATQGDISRINTYVSLYNRLIPVLGEISKHVSPSDIAWQDHCEHVMHELLGEYMKR